jgi:DNA-binding LytR/AlgR family response regulator
MIKCIAIDDEPLALELIEIFCQQIPFLQLEKTFTQTSAANKYLGKFPVDLIFLDIQMPDINGIEFFKSIKQKVMVIFITAHSNYAVESYDVNAVDYLLKPLQPDRFILATNKAKDFYDYQNNKTAESLNYLYIRSDYSLIKISFSDILYLETMDDYIKVHQIGKKPIHTLMSMKKMMERLPKTEFIRVHRSYIVSLSRIESVRAKSISLGTVDLPIGASYEKNFYKVYVKDKS